MCNQGKHNQGYSLSQTSFSYPLYSTFCFFFAYLISPMSDSGLFFFFNLQWFGPRMHYSENNSQFGVSWVLQSTCHQLTVSHLVSLSLSPGKIVLFDWRIMSRQASGLDLKTSRDKESRTCTGCVVAKHPHYNPIYLASAFSCRSLIILSFCLTEASCL